MCCIVDGSRVEGVLRLQTAMRLLRHHHASDDLSNNDNNGCSTTDRPSDIQIDNRSAHDLNGSSELQTWRAAMCDQTGRGEQVGRCGTTTARAATTTFCSGTAS